MGEEIKTIIVKVRLTEDERETHIFRTKDGWQMDSTDSREYNKALKRKWKPIVKYQYTDGTVCGYILKAESYGLSIRTNEKRTVNLTEEQKAIRAERMRNLRAKKNAE